MIPTAAIIGRLRPRISRIPRAAVIGVLLPALWLALALPALPLPAMAQGAAQGDAAEKLNLDALQQEDLNQGFYDLQELIRLIEIARESGFSEEQIREITIEDQGRVINAWEYLKEIQARRAAEEQRIREQESRVYLTVQDVVEDLMKMEQKDLHQLRESLLFSR
jgi:hypothetical protein